MHRILVVIIHLIYTYRFSNALSTQQGLNNWATYYEGNAPIIILSQHGGDQVPASIPDREDGCYNTDTGKCIWEHDCEINYSPYTQSSSKCGAKLLPDGKTKEIATCLRNEIDLFDNNRANIPHLVVNQLRRSKLDPNRPVDQATLGNADATQVYNDIHSDFMEQAKTAVFDQCGWGLVFDIHGQAANDFNQLGYRLRDSDLEQDDATLNLQKYSTSIQSLALDNTQNDDLATIVRGPDSLGTIMNETYEYLMVPSRLQPHLDDEYYYQGYIGILKHGSDYGGKVDAIQIEVNADIRWQRNGGNRTKFCIDFSRAIETFVKHYYDLSQCSGVLTAAQVPIPIIDVEISSALVIILTGLLFINIMCLGFYCVKVKRKGNLYKKVISMTDESDIE